MNVVTVIMVIFAVLAVGLLEIPDATVKGFIVFGIFIRILVIAGLSTSVTPFEMMKKKSRFLAETRQKTRKYFFKNLLTKLPFGDILFSWFVF